MKRLLIATTNPGKIEEISKFLADVPVELVSLKDLHITQVVEETGKTFEENAVLKAKFYAGKSGLPAIADDGGLEIDALGGEPGVKSHRWVHGDRDSTDEELIAYTMERMRDIPEGNRSAQLRTVIALASGTGPVVSETGSIRGIIPRVPSGSITPGFPYRSLLFLPQYGKFYDTTQLSEGEMATVNHRASTLEKLKPKILGYIMEISKGD
jgi:XTP/dITP diphosphohydrolase